MELLERLWEGTNSVVNGVMTGVGRGLTGVFGTSNARAVRRHSEIAAQINALEPRLMALSDAELREHTAKLKARLTAGETLDDILVDAFALCREGGRRFLKMRHYDVQLVGGMVLHGGNIAEMVTGEGKTLVATLPAFLNALEGRGVHVVTVNDYLARRDMEWMAPLYMGLGLSVAAIQSGLPTGQRQAAYAADITYATNNELGFDYLRDNMRMASRGDDRFPKEYQQSQGPLHYAIIDEVDNILIDEARTPLIISGPAHQDPGKYQDADRIARQLKIDDDFIVSEKDHTVNLTDEGIRKAEKLAGVESFYTSGNMEWPHLIDNSLKAHHLYKRDVNYVVKDGTVVIVDEFTGRLMEGRQWSDGLHQSVEAKEGVKIKEENQTLATITLQNYFKLYRKLSGMTGTAMTEQTEFYKTYKLDVVAIPTNRDMQRIEQSDIIFVTEKAKYKAIADDIETLIKFDQLEMKNGEVVVGTIVKENDSAIELRKRNETGSDSIERSQVRRVLRSGRPILVGTVSIEKSERLSKLLEHRGIPHQVLNAKQHKREADIVAQAGRMGAVTIATNMAGRGTDIILGGNPENKAWGMLQDKYPTRLEVPKEEWNELVTRIEEEEQMKPEGERIRSLGGLMVIGTERHESRRIDLQLRGRCGRQGDPGESRFYLSLEDDLMRIFAGDWVKGMMSRLGVGEDEAIQSSFVSKRISAAQKKVEERHFEARKSLLEYDEVMDHQRKRVYGYRQQILDGVSTRKLVLEQIHQQINHAVESYTAPVYGAESFARFASEKLSCELDAKEFRGVDIDTAGNYARDLAERAAETQIVDAIEENLPESEPQEEWNYETLAKWSNERYKTNYTAASLKKIDRSSIDEELVKQAHNYIANIDLSEGAEYLQDDYGTRMLAKWLKAKFSIDAEINSQAEAESIKKNLRQVSEDAYRQREVRYPIEVALNTFATPGPNGQPVQLSADIAPWLAQRLDDPSLETSLFDGTSVNLSPAFESSKLFSQRAEDQLQAGLGRVAQLFADGQDEKSAAVVAAPEQVDTLGEWMRDELHWRGDLAKLHKLTRRELENQVQQAVDDRFFTEIRAAERQVLLQILDETWMAHLLAMDHLRSAVTFRGMGQMDPKIEYKREGMRLFETMWSSVGERVTDVIFRMSTSVARTPVPPMPRRTAVEHHDEPPAGDYLNEPLQQTDTTGAVSTASRNSQPQQRPEAEGGDQRVQTIRRSGDRVGRNDPCPCGSGKKYKNCCLRMS